MHPAYTNAWDYIPLQQIISSISPYAEHFLQLSHGDDVGVTAEHDYQRPFSLT